MRVNSTIHKANLDTALANGTIGENDITFVKDPDNFEGIVLGNGDSHLDFNTVPSFTPEEKGKILHINDNGIVEWEDSSSVIKSIDGDFTVKDTLTAKSIKLTSFPSGDNQTEVPSIGWVENKLDSVSYASRMVIPLVQSKSIEVIDILMNIKSNKRKAFIPNNSTPTIIYIDPLNANYCEGLMGEVLIQTYRESSTSPSVSDMIIEFRRALDNLTLFSIKGNTNALFMSFTLRFVVDPFGTLYMFILDKNNCTELTVTSQPYSLSQENLADEPTGQYVITNEELIQMKEAVEENPDLLRFIEGETEEPIQN